MKKIVFVNRFFYPDLSATSKMLSDLAFHLAHTGREIHVVTSRQKIDNPNAALPAAETLEGVHIHRVWTTAFGRGSLFLRFFDAATFYGQAYWALMFILKPDDIVVCKTDPPLIGVAAAEACFFKRARLVNWAQDVFPETAEKLGVRPVRIIAPILRFLRNLAYRTAWKNVAIGEGMGHYLAQFVPASKITVIPNWADGEQIQPLEAEGNALRKSWGLENKFVVGYSGNLGRAHDFETVLAAAEILKNNPDIIFLFIGSGKKKAWVETQAKERRLPNVRFQDFQPENILSQSLGAIDVHLVTLEPSLEGLVLPSKFYGVLAAGRPVVFIGDPKGELAELIRKHQCGAAFGAGQGQGLADELCRWAKKRDIVTQMGRAARQIFEIHFEKRIALRSWSALLECIR